MVRHLPVYDEEYSLFKIFDKRYPLFHSLLFYSTTAFNMFTSKVNKSAQELIQSDPHQVLNIKGIDRQLKLNSHKKNVWQAELTKLFSKNVATLVPKLTECL